METEENNQYFMEYNTRNIHKNKLHFDDTTNDNTPVYRVYAMEYFIQLFEKRENTLVKPKAWDDPWENFLLKQVFHGHPTNLPVYMDGISDKYYGQCWTFKENEDDALWRIYSPICSKCKYKTNGVRIKTKFGKLWNSFVKMTDKGAMLSYFIGKVQYLPEHEIRDFFENQFHGSEISVDQSGKIVVETLLIKRKEFEHEKELRLIYRTDNAANPLYKYEIDPNDFIEEVLFDPRTDDSLCQSMEQRLRTEFNFTGKISKSNLYHIPNLQITW